MLPPDVTFDWADLSFQERRAPGVATVFALAIFLVFLILAAQYESWGLPFSVLLGTPFAAFGAYLGLYLARQFLGPSYVNNVFAQIGLIMLIGLAAKNAILIVEFAKMELEAGKPLMEATMSAAKLRFRPILMTAFAFILGVVPLLTASGAGAEGRKVMGMTVFAGMLVATILGVCLIPDVVRLRREGDRWVEEACSGNPGRAASVAGDRARAGESLRCSPPPLHGSSDSSRLRVCRPDVSSVPTTSGRSLRARSSSASLKARRRSRWPTRPGSGVRGSGAAGPDQDRDREQPRSPRCRRARRGDARACRHREVVPVSAGRRCRQLSRSRSDERGAGRDRRRGHVPPEHELRIPVGVGTRSVRQAPAAERSRIGPGAGK